MRTIEQMISSEVLCCMSSLVSTLAAGYGADIRTGFAPNDRDLSDLTEQAFELAAPIDDWEEAAIQAGEIRPTEPFQLVASLVGLCVFPFMGKPMIQFMSGKNEKEFKQFIEDRKAHVEMLLLDGLFVKND